MFTISHQEYLDGIQYKLPVGEGFILGPWATVGDSTPIFGRVPRVRSGPEGLG